MLIVVGGVDAGQALASSELLDFGQTGAAWSTSTSLPTPMWGARGVLLGGRFLLLGGFARSYQDSILAWDPVSQVFHCGTFTSSGHGHWPTQIDGSFAGGQKFREFRTPL